MERGDGKEGSRVNAGKTKIMWCRLSIGQAEDSEEYPCGVCRKRADDIFLFFAVAGPLDSEGHGASAPSKSATAYCSQQQIHNCLVFDGHIYLMTPAAANLFRYTLESGNHFGV